MATDLADEIARDLAAAWGVRKFGPADLRDVLRRFIPDFGAFKDAIVAELKQTFLSGYRGAAPEAPLTDSVTARAEAFSLERAGELITDITDVTRDGVKELVASAVEENLSLGELRAALEDYTGFGSARAETIARTESAFALGKAQRAAADDQGMDEKQWLGGDCPICVDNAGSGWIGIDEVFDGGDDDIPSHPNCSCAVKYRVRPAEAGDEEDKAKTLVMVKEARCPECRRWVGRNIPVGSEVFCPKHKSVRITS